MNKSKVDTEYYESICVYKIQTETPITKKKIKKNKVNRNDASSRDSNLVRRVRTDHKQLNYISEKPLQKNHRIFKIVEPNQEMLNDSLAQNINFHPRIVYPRNTLPIIIRRQKVSKKLLANNENVKPISGLNLIEIPYQEINNKKPKRASSNTDYY